MNHRKGQGVVNGNSGNVFAKSSGVPTFRFPDPRAANPGPEPPSPGQWPDTLGSRFPKRIPRKMEGKSRFPRRVRGSRPGTPDRCSPGHSPGIPDIAFPGISPGNREGFIVQVIAIPRGFRPFILPMTRNTAKPINVATPR